MTSIGIVVYYRWNMHGFDKAMEGKDCSIRDAIIFDWFWP